MNLHTRLASRDNVYMYMFDISCVMYNSRCALRWVCYASSSVRTLSTHPAPPPPSSRAVSCRRGRRRRPSTPPSSPPPTLLLCCSTHSGARCMNTDWSLLLAGAAFHTFTQLSQVRLEALFRSTDVSLRSRPAQYRLLIGLDSLSLSTLCTKRPSPRLLCFSILVWV